MSGAAQKQHTRKPGQGALSPRQERVGHHQATPRPLGGAFLLLPHAPQEPLPRLTRTGTSVHSALAKLGLWLLHPNFRFQRTGGPKCLPASCLGEPVAGPHAEDPLLSVQMWLCGRYEVFPRA